MTANTLLRAATSSLSNHGAGVAIEAVAALARRKSLNDAQKVREKGGPAKARAVEEPGVGDLSK